MKKETVKSSFVGAVIMWGASWIGFLVSFIPLYIFRGVYHDMATKERLEDVIMTAFGMLGAVVFLLIYRKVLQMRIGTPATRTGKIASLCNTFAPIYESSRSS